MALAPRPGQPGSAPQSLVHAWPLEAAPLAPLGEFPAVLSVPNICISSRSFSAHITKSLRRSLLFGAGDQAQPLEVVTRQRYQLYLVLELEEKRGRRDDTNTRSNSCTTQAKCGKTLCHQRKSPCCLLPSSRVLSLVARWSLECAGHFREGLCYRQQARFTPAFSYHLYSNR